MTRNGGEYLGMCGNVGLQDVERIAVIIDVRKYSNSWRKNYVVIIVFDHTSITSYS